MITRFKPTKHVFTVQDPRNTNQVFIKRALDEKHNHCLVGLKSDNVVAAISYYYFNKVCFIKYLGSIEPGFGSQLLKKTIENARFAGCKSIRVDSTKSANTFYEKHGFELYKPTVKSIYILHLTKS